MQTITAATIVAAALPLWVWSAEPYLTLVQRDPWRSSSDTPSAAVSADGRYIAFTSFARLVRADTNDVRDVYVLDRADGRVTLESVTAAGLASGEDSSHPRLSGDGRFLVYETRVGSASDVPDARHVVLRDRYTNTMRIVSAGPHGKAGNDWSGTPAISQDGRVVAFASASMNLVEGPDANGPGVDVYLFEGAGSIRRVSVNSDGIQPSSGSSFAPSVSADGRFVAFTSTAALADSATVERAGAARRRSPLSHVYVRDSQLNVTTHVSAGPALQPADGPSWAPSVSGDGRYVVFVSAATNLAPSDRNGVMDVFAADLHTRLIELVSRSIRGGAGNGPSGSPAISADGRFIAFQSEASDLVCARRCTAEHEDINLLSDVFLLDRRSRAIVRLSADPAGAWMEASSAPALDAAGTLVAFSSRHPIDASDQLNDFDLFVRHRE